ncbi:MAG: ribonuclease III [Nitrospirae bacterium]|nr:ribonuclease III [Nitrospirota bacterium]
MPVSSSENLEKLEKDLGYSFRDRALLAEALTHRSYHHENPAKVLSYNERLEFMGDSVLGLVIVEYLFTRDKEMSESEMSKIKSYLVRGSLLSEIAADISLGQYLRLGKGEEETGGRNKKSILADAMEAIFGALYLEGGYEAARSSILRLFGDRIGAVLSSGQYHSFKTELQEESQMRFGTLPEYRLVSEEGEEHLRTFTVEVFIGGKRFGRGTGKNKKEAQTAAAKEAMAQLKKDAGG